MKFNRAVYTIQFIGVQVSCFVGLFVYVNGKGDFGDVTLVYLFGIAFQIIMVIIDWFNRGKFSWFQLLLILVSIGLLLLLLSGKFSKYDNRTQDAYIQMTYTLMLVSYVATLIPIYNLMKQSKLSN